MSPNSEPTDICECAILNVSKIRVYKSITHRKSIGFHLKKNFTDNKF